MFTKYFLMGGKYHGGQYPNQEWYQKILFLSTYWEGPSCFFHATMIICLPSGKVLMTNSVLNRFGDIIHRLITINF